MEKQNGEALPGKTRQKIKIILFTVQPPPTNTSEALLSPTLRHIRNCGRVETRHAIYRAGKDNDLHLFGILTLQRAPWVAP